MKNIKIGKIALFAFIATTLSFASCSEWTEMESIEVVQPNIENQNPKLYAQYLEQLRNYKKTNHKTVYAWFDNSVKVPYNRSQHITEIPDSVDVVALMYPENLVNREVEEIANIRERKGTKVIYSIDYDAMKLIYDTRLADQKAAIKGGQVIDPSNVMPDFITFMVDSLGHSLSLADKYNFDGISVSYLGKATIHLTDQEYKEYIETQNVFVGMVKSWIERHSTKLFVFEGNPQNLLDKSILSYSKNILLPTLSAKNEYDLEYCISLAKVEGVPTDRFGIKASTTSLDDADKKTGYFSDGSRALPVTSKWAISAHNNYSVNGFGILNVNNDYYNLSLVYKNVRNAITTLNPSIK